jgi:hypothetical protein
VETLNSCIYDLFVVFPFNKQGSDCTGIVMPLQNLFVKEFEMVPFTLDAVLRIEG